MFVRREVETATETDGITEVLVMVEVNSTVETLVLVELDTVVEVEVVKKNEVVVEVVLSIDEVLEVLLLGGVGVAVMVIVLTLVSVVGQTLDWKVVELEVWGSIVVVEILVLVLTLKGQFFLTS